MFGFWTIGLCVYVFLRRVCDRVTCSRCEWIAGLIAEFICVLARGNCVCFRCGFASGWVDVRVDVLRDVSMCVCPCVDVWMPDLRLGVCVVEPPRVLISDNSVICKCVCVSEARMLVMTGLLCVCVFFVDMLAGCACLCARICGGA